MFHACSEECRRYRDKDHPVKGHWVIGKYEFNRCPRSQIDPESYLWMEAYRLYLQGVLPQSGGWMEQTEKFISIMVWMSGMIAEHEKEHGQKQNRHRAAPSR